MQPLAALQGLPSRGTLTSIQPGAAFISQPVSYVADHDTAPPEHQVVKSDPTSLLIRSLQSKRTKDDAKRKVTKAADKGKRPADEGEGGSGARSTKRPAHDGVGPSGSGAAAGGGSGCAGGVVPGPSESSYTRLGLQAKTIKDLQAILRAWNLAISGKKDDLIVRVLEHQAGARS